MRPPRIRRPLDAGAPRGLITHWLSVGQDLILVGVALVLLLAGLVIVFDAVRELFNALAARNIAEVIFSIAENALLALILAELIHTLLVTLGGAPLSAEPFPVIAIIAILRKMLFTSVLAPKVAEEGLLAPAVVELFVLGLLILILGAALALLRDRRQLTSLDPSMPGTETSAH